MAHSFRIFISGQKLESGSIISLSHEDTHHLVHVARLPPLSSLIVVDTDHQVEFEATLLYEKKDGRSRVLDSAAASLEKERTSAPFNGLPRITIFAAMCKGATNEALVQNATELGAEAVVFSPSERSIVRELSSAKMDRINKIIYSSSQQSARISLLNCTTIDSLLSISQVPTKNAARFVGALTENSPSVVSYLPLETSMEIAIGPEGDFSARELELLFSKGFKPLSLGPLRYRSEMAVSVALTTLITSYLISTSK